VRIPATSLSVALTVPLLASALAAQSWSAVPTNTDPGDRVDAAAAFDLVRSQTVLFGGDRVNSLYPNDTWTYDGIDWSVASPSTPSYSQVDRSGEPKKLVPPASTQTPRIMS